jgi:hypothetical protein
MRHRRLDRQHGAEEAHAARLDERVVRVLLDGRRRQTVAGRVHEMIEGAHLLKECLERSLAVAREVERVSRHAGGIGIVLLLRVGETSDGALDALRVGGGDDDRGSFLDQR